MEYPKYNLKVYQGEDKDLYLAFYSLDTETNEKHITNLEDSKFVMTFRESLQSSPLLVLSSEEGDIVLGKFEDDEFIETNESPNIVKISLPSHVTVDMTIPKMFYDLFQYQNDKRVMLLHGNLFSQKSVRYE